MSIILNKPTITRDDLEGVLESLINDELSSGASVKNFEAAAAGLAGLKYSLAVNSLTSAYHLVFRALDIDEGSEVIIPSYFSQAPLSALSLCRGKAVIVDNDENSLFPSLESIREKVTTNTRAIVAGHMFGSHFDVKALGMFNVPVIEDISHSVGTLNDDAAVGSGSAFAVLSFEPSMIITTGNGGMVLTGNSRHYSVMRDLRGNKADQISLDCTMTDFQGAMGVTQLKKLNKLLVRRRDIARVYYDAVKRSPHKTPFLYNENFAFQSFPVIFDTPSDRVEKYWKKNKIEVINPIGFPMHRLLGLSPSDFPNSERYSRKLFTIPLYPTLTKKEIEVISKHLSSFI